MNKMAIRVESPNSKHSRIFGPFLNEEVARKFLKEYGWTEFESGKFILDKANHPDTQIVCTIGEWIESTIHFRSIMPTHA